MAVVSTASLSNPFDDDLDQDPSSGIRRSHVATLPSLREAATAAGVAAEDSWDGIAPDAPASLVGQMPDWCVDLGDEMVALHAVELYTRLATGSIPPSALVWRIGREAWLPACDVPELRYAIEDARASALDLDDFSFFESAMDDVEAALAFAQAG